MKRARHDVEGGAGRGRPGAPVGRGARQLSAFVLVALGLAPACAPTHDEAATRAVPTRSNQEVSPQPPRAETLVEAEPRAEVPLAPESTSEPTFAGADSAADDDTGPRFFGSSIKAGPTVLIGSVHLTKGAQPMLRGVLMRPEDFKAHLGKDWRKYIDRRVRVEGEVAIHRCGPQEQCLTTGQIPHFGKLKSIELCASPMLGKSTSVPTVNCPVDAAERDLCLATCQRQSDTCDADASASSDPDETRGALRRCGCAKISCEGDCPRTGVADFRCR